MKKILVSLILLVVSSSSSIAAEKDYKICSIAGYFLGYEYSFLRRVAGRVAVKQQMDLINDPICNATWKNANEIAKNLAKLGKLRNETDVTVYQQASKFELQVYDAIISNMNY